MKNVCSILFLFISTIIFSQNQLKEGSYIKLKNTIEVQSKDISYLNDNALKNKVYDNLYLEQLNYEIIEIGDNSVKLKVAKIAGNNNKQKKLKNAYEGKIFTISKDDFYASAESISKPETLSIGILSLPFKFRPNKETVYETEFNLNTAININVISLNDETTFNIQLGAGIGSVGLDTINSTGIENDETQNVSALTFLYGIMFQYKKVQFGIYSGWDHINNQSKYSWESNANPWLSFGIGYSIFKISEKEPVNR
ncbi:hypothetical protein [Robertkochia solimangrovi]|uniref:hypothetical protein n=1 Tax=Robertkochia solimangrovi TaxID=2213046 RepID=UPI00117C1B59|nr:hypothetical protein [Robertkochia solimangrovi]TRZ42557.1 hypothetical protein DMZ48_13735 [Robertkochia solimangrovi]